MKLIRCVDCKPSITYICIGNCSGAKNCVYITMTCLCEEHTSFSSNMKKECNIRIATTREQVAYAI